MSSAGSQGGKRTHKRVMLTRNEFLASLIPVTNLPEDIETECPICAEDFVEPVQLCWKHFFCRGCVIKWLTRRKRNTCPTCRRMLFDPTETDRWSFEVDRMRILSQALERSGLLGHSFDAYGSNSCTVAEVQRAAAAANQYLIQDSHPPITGVSKVCIDMRILGPHIIAMGNILREVARITNRGYSAYQRRDWRIVIGHVMKRLEQMDCWVFEGDDLVYMAQDLRLATLMCLRAKNVDVRSSRFFNIDAPLDSPSGDLDCLLDYIVHQGLKDFERRVMGREAHQRAQTLALQNEASKTGYVLRWTKQRVFNLV